MLINIEKRPVYPLVSKMLDKAFEQLKDGDTPILHSDQGWHYQMKKYHNAIEKTRHIHKVCHVKGIV